MAWKIPESVLVVIHSVDGQVLLIRRVVPAGEVAHWQSVTGAKDTPDEAWEETARREVWEETGIDCRLGSPWADALSDWCLENHYDIYPRWQHRYAPGVVRNTERVFGLCLPAPQGVRLSPTEHTDAVWLPWREAADRCFSPSNAEAILWLPQHLEGLRR